MANSANKVVVVTSSVDARSGRSFEDGVELIRVPALNISERWGAPYPIFSPFLFFTLWRTIKDADIVHAHDAFYMSSFIATFIAWLQGKPLVLTQHVAMISHPSRMVMAIERIIYATTGQFIFSKSRAIMSLNDRVDDFLVRHGVPKDKILKLPNGVDTSIFYPVTASEKSALRAKYGMSKTKKIVLFVGRFVPKKGFHKLLAARDNRYQIVFVGGDAPEESNEEVLFLGKLPQSSLAEIYQAADLFVLPSEDEGFPLSVQEAMATGLPIITSDDYGYARYNFDRQKMHFIADPTEESVREAIQAVIRDDDLMQVMSDYSHQFAHTHFHWPNIIMQLEDIYNTAHV